MEDFRAKYEDLKIKLDKANEEISVLQAFNGNYENISRYIEDFVWLMDKNNEIIYVTPSIISAFGSPGVKINTNFLLNIVPADVRSVLDQEMCDRLRNEASNTKKKWTTKIKDKNSNELWVEIVINPIILENGEFNGVMGIAHDITKQKETEIALRKSEEEFRTIFENTGSAISIQTDKNILLVNRAWEQITGYTLEEARELSPMDLIHPAERDITFANTLKRLKGESVDSNYQFHLVDKHYNEKWINNTATLIDYNGVKAILVIGSDITDRKNTEQELNKLSTGIINSPLSIVITDIDGTIEYVNPFFTEVTGYTSEEAIGENPKVLSSGNNSRELYESLWSTILNGDIWQGEFENRTKSGRVYWESARIAPIIDESGIITNFIAIKEDITERKKAFDIIEKSEKYLRETNAKKDKFFSIISHDLRSPFSGIIGLVDILKMSFKELDDDKVEYYLEMIHNSAKNTYKLLENLLAWAKSQTGKVTFDPQKHNLYELVDSVVAVSLLSAENKSISIKVDVNNDETVFADADMLNTVIRNLISNALKYTHKDGVIRVFVEDAMIKDKAYKVIGVEDNGVGVPKQNQGKLFEIEANYSTAGTEKEKGTGLGLLLCKEFVERHSGRIWCDSVEGEGSIFYFSLPN